MTQRRKTEKPEPCPSCKKPGGLRLICSKCMRLIGCRECYEEHTKGNAVRQGCHVR